MSRFSLTRRAVLQSTAMLAAAALPRKAFARQDGRLVVAADSEPKNLNPAIVASN
ncbi:MAG: ABC transporter substrate-binding protein, partial [Pseudomonadota bacterium]|nr:ABC transporter substrate-binding protein [Pseudomonadota bacterium]